MQKLDCTVASAPAAQADDQLPVVVGLDRYTPAGVRTVGDGEAVPRAVAHRRDPDGRAEQAGDRVQRVDAHVRQRPDLGAEEGRQVGVVAVPRRRWRGAVRTHRAHRPDQSRGEQLRRTTDLREHHHRRGGDDHGIRRRRGVGDAGALGAVAGDRLLRVEVLAGCPRRRG